jgi:hypothetical protein
MIETIDGVVTNESHGGEPWEYSTTITEKLVTGWLRDKVLERVGKSEGEVTSWENSSSYGSCEIGGSYWEDIKLFVNGEEVYSGGDSSGMDRGDYPNPFTALNNWLNKKENN